MDFIKHTVKKGENLTKIAKKYGFAGGDWKKIYDHPKNAAFRKLRPNPDMIEPKDTLMVPAKPGKEIDAEVKALGAMRVKLLSMPVSLKKIMMQAQRMNKETMRISKSGTMIQSDIQQLRGMQALHRSEVVILDKMTTQCQADAKSCVAESPKSFAIFQKRQEALAKLINTLKTIDDAEKHLRSDPKKAMFAVDGLNKDVIKITKLTAEWTKAHNDALKEIDARMKSLETQRKQTI